MSVFAPFETAQADPNAAARAWKASGGKVVGYLGNAAPVELIAATGAFPLRLAGLADETPLADRYMEPLFDPVVRAVFETLLAGGYGFLDAIVLPRASDSVQRLYYYLCEIGRMGEAEIPPALLYDVLQTPWYSSAEYNLARTAELKAALEAITGQAADDAALRAAIATGNRRRAGLEAFAALRHRRPAGVSGAEAQAVFAASQVMAPDAFHSALDAVLAAPPASHAGPRVVLAGSGQPTPALHRIIEAAGAVVVGDFHEFGELMAGAPIAETGSPLRAIAEHYHRHVLTSRTFPQDPGRLLEFARAAGADGVVFYFLFEEEALTWEYPAQKRALEAAGIATICFENMPPRPDAAALREPIAAFADRIRVGAPA